MSKNIPKDAEMSDAVMTPDARYAKSILEEIWDPDVYSRGSIIRFAYEGIKRVERSLSDAVLRQRKRQWTERRIRSIVDDEEPALERYEILDLEKMAVKEGRHAYRKSIERASRMAAFLAHCDEDFHITEIDARIALARALAGPGVGVVTGGTSAVRAGARGPGERLGRVRRTGTPGADE